MRWPWSGAESEKDDKDRIRSGAWNAILNVTDWSQYTKTETILPSVALTFTTLAAIRIYKSYFRRVPNVDYIKPGSYRKRSVFGKVTSVGDADNFRLFHTPGGRMAGWEWLPWKKVPKKGEGLTADKTVGILLQIYQHRSWWA